MRPKWQEIVRGLATGPAFLSAAPALADITLSLPVDCTLGDTCYIQQYTDRDPGSGVQDFMCAGLSYDGHKGTDFALPTLADLTSLVPVIAAADGTVTATRNTMPDELYDRDNPQAVEGRECGNGVVLRHGDGWETQYCHLAEGSVTVSPGDQVTRGQRLGVIGLSGRTEFPHMQLSVRHNGMVVDPFAPDQTAACGPQDDTLWDTPPAYVPGGLLRVGLTGRAPSFTDVTVGYALAPPSPTDPLIGWALLFGTRASDSVVLTITGPEGEVHRSSHERRQQALAFQFAGTRPPTGGWPPGDYHLMVELWRDGIAISAETQTITMP